MEHTNLLLMEELKSASSMSRWRWTNAEKYNSHTWLIDVQFCSRISLDPSLPGPNYRYVMLALRPLSAPPFFWRASMASFRSIIKRFLLGDRRCGTEWSWLARLTARLKTTDLTVTRWLSPHRWASCDPHRYPLQLGMWSVVASWASVQAIPARLR